MIEIGAADGWSGDNIESIDPDSNFERSFLFFFLVMRRGAKVLGIVTFVVIGSRTQNAQYSEKLFPGLIGAGRSDGTCPQVPAVDVMFTLSAIFSYTLLPGY